MMSTTMSETCSPRTIAVLGAGAPGLAYAREVERLGHRAIVLESAPYVGGPCTTEIIDGRLYDICGRMCSSEYRQLGALIAEMGLETEPTRPVYLFDHVRCETVQLGTSDHRLSLKRYGELQRLSYGKLSEPGLACAQPDLHLPVREWLSKHQVEDVFDTVGSFYTAAGYGYMTDDVPALFFAKLAAFTGLVTNPAPLFGHRAPFTVSGGMRQLWEKVAGELGDVRCEAGVVRIDRTDAGVKLHTAKGTVSADAVVLTIALDQALHLIDPDPEERRIASRIQRIDYYTTLCRVSRLPRSGFYIPTRHVVPPGEPGRLVTFHSPYPDTDWCVCYSYGGDGLSPQEVTSRLAQEVRLLGGELLEVRTQKRWARMPHFSGPDIAAGIYESIEARQGARNTYLAGSLPAFELNECNITYSQQLARRFFTPSA
ncbi:protoporphyrinogen/coproporphyrinogen oxidase [Streptomyces lavendofoliae]|uniref:protoporphyrinogen/coproporphyrinogen oxidase n=1 Tax=Streptomyces lavendofoliae TaxID=67314 RepID=UPI003D8EE39A